MIWLLTLSLAQSADPIPTWMVGCWQTHDGPSCREVWSGPRADVALGHAICEGDWGVSWEHLWLGNIDGTRTLVIHPRDQASHAFPLEEEGPGQLVFADPEHDFPQRLVYRRGPDGLVVDVTGTPEGAPEPTAFTLEYTPCGQTAPPRGAPTPAEPATCNRPDPWISRQLRDAAKADAKDREKASAEVRMDRSSVRRGLALAAMESGSVCSAEDAWHAGLMLQRAGRSDDHERAFSLLHQACDAGFPSACPHAAGAWDAYLVSRGAPAWFGAAFKGEGGAACMVALDPDSSDASRETYGAPLLEAVSREAWRRLTGKVPADASYEALVEAGLICPP